MATFPSLLPNARSYDPGLYPVSNEATSAGSVRFLHGPASSLQPLDLQFNNLTLAQARLIRTHYRNVNGGHQDFLLSASIRAGLNNFSIIFPSTTSVFDPGVFETGVFNEDLLASTRFRYTSPPKEQHKSGGLIDVTVQIQSVI